MEVSAPWDFGPFRVKDFRFLTAFVHAFKILHGDELSRVEKRFYAHIRAQYRVRSVRAPLHYTYDIFSYWHAFIIDCAISLADLRFQNTLLKKDFVMCSFIFTQSVLVYVLYVCTYMYVHVHERSAKTNYLKRMCLDFFFLSISSCHCYHYD